MDAIVLKILIKRQIDPTSSSATKMGQLPSEYFCQQVQIWILDVRKNTFDDDDDQYSDIDH